MARKILILGGTSEARQFAERLAERRDLAVTLSLAGRTTKPVRHPVPLRVGGFGGIAGLARYLRDTRTHVLVDATHPFAAQMSINAATAAATTGVAFMAIRRLAWQAIAGDRWAEATSIADALELAGSKPRSIFAALGRQELAPLLAAPQHRYLIRSIEPVTPPLALPRATYILGRGPFEIPDEVALLRDSDIDLVLAKNSGGAAAYAKLAAARALSIEVILVTRPDVPDVTTVATDAAAAVIMLDHLLSALPDGLSNGDDAECNPRGE